MRLDSLSLRHYSTEQLPHTTAWFRTTLWKQRTDLKLRARVPTQDLEKFWGTVFFGGSKQANIIETNEQTLHRRNEGTGWITFFVVIFYFHSPDIREVVDLDTHDVGGLIFFFLSLSFIHKLYGYVVNMCWCFVYQPLNHRGNWQWGILNSSWRYNWLLWGDRH